MDYCPFVDTQNRILYFTSRRNSIDEKAINTNNLLEAEILKYQNGTSRIYKVDFELDYDQN